jgi:ERCC4-type nuclease
MDSNQAIKSETLIASLRSQEGVLIESLDSGDLCFMGRGEDKQLSVNIGVELKVSPEDVLASLRDGRLMTQPPRLLADYDLAYIITVGSETRINFSTGKAQEKKKGKWIDSPYDFHYLNSILVKFEAAGGRIRHVQDENHLVSFLLSLHRYWQKVDHSETTFFRKRHKFSDWRQLDNPLAEVYERMGIGIQRAIKLAEYCPSIQELVNANERDISVIPIPGKKPGDVRNFGRGSAKKVTAFITQGGVSTGS